MVPTCNMTGMNVHLQDVLDQAETVFNKSFTNNGVIQQHCQIHTDEKPYVCGVCNKSFLINYLRQGCLFNLDEKPHTCDICNESFTFKTELQLHYVIHCDDKPHVCSLCDDGCANNVVLKPRSITPQRKSHICDICNKSFSKKQRLQKHYLTHSVNKCDSNDPKTDDKGHTDVIETDKKSSELEPSDEGLSAPIDKKNDQMLTNSETSHACEVCQECFQEEAELEKHHLTHNNNKTYSCKICNSDFTNEEEFSKHLETHNSDQAPVDVSEKKHSKKRGLLHFSRTSERPYVCYICSKAFRTKRELQNHHLIHTDKKPHQCDVCHKSFKLKQDLNRHSLIHTGVKPHVCDVCNKAFARKDNLRQHCLTHK